MLRNAPTRELMTVGARVRHWREQRGYSQVAFAKLCGIPQGTLPDLENNRTAVGKNLHTIAAKLRVDANYLQTGEGAPQSETGHEPPPVQAQVDWPLPAVQRQQLEKLNRIELAYVENAMLLALQQVEEARRQRKKG